MFCSQRYDNQRASAKSRPCSKSYTRPPSQRNDAWQALAMRPRALQGKATGGQPCAACEQEDQLPGSASTKNCCGTSTRGMFHARAQSSGDESTVPVKTEQEKREYDFHKEHQCSNQPDPTAPQTKPMTSREMTRAVFGLLNAKAIASRAYSNLGQRDPYHLKKAEKTFQKPVSFEVLDSHVGKVKSALDSLTINQNVVAATCDEVQCNDGQHNFVAVTLNDLSGILLCPFYFLQPGRTLATTFLHEAGHKANIDVNWAPGNEKYCRPDDVIECGNICPLTGENLLENVDAWMRLIYCIAMSS